MALKVERVAVVETAAAAVVVVAWNWGKYEGGDRGGAGLSSTIHCVWVDLVAQSLPE